MFWYSVKKQNVENKCDSCFVVWWVRGKFGFLLRCCWWCEVLWLLVEFGVAKELVEFEVSNCTTIRFIFMVFLFFIGEMELF